MLTRLHDLLRLRTSPPIFFGAAALIILFVITTVFFTEPLDAAVTAASDWLYTNLGWFYIFGLTLFLVYLILIAISRFGGVTLGSDDEPPEHSRLSVDRHAVCRRHRQHPDVLGRGRARQPLW